VGNSQSNATTGNILPAVTDGIRHLGRPTGNHHAPRVRTTLQRVAAHTITRHPANAAQLLGPPGQGKNVDGGEMGQGTRQSFRKTTRISKARQ